MPVRTGRSSNPFLTWELPRHGKIVAANFDRRPTLEGPKFRLRPLAASDHDAFVAVANDPLVWAEHPEADRATPEKVEGYFADALASGGARIGIDNTRTRAVEALLGAVYVGTVPTPLGDHAVYELSRSAWAERA